MTSFSRLEGGTGGNRIPNLSQENDIWALSQSSAKALGKGGGIGAHLALGEAAEIFLKEVFDRVLNRDDVAGGGLIEPLEASGHRGGFSRSGGACHEDKA